MLQIILLTLVAITAIFIGIVSIQPSTFRVARTASISAPAPVGGQFEKGLAQIKAEAEAADYLAPQPGKSR